MNLIKFDNARNKWVAKINIKGKGIYLLGYFETEQEAKDIQTEAELKYNG